MQALAASKLDASPSGGRRPCNPDYGFLAQPWRRHAEPCAFAQRPHALGGGTGPSFPSYTKPNAHIAFDWAVAPHTCMQLAGVRLMLIIHSL